MNNTCFVIMPIGTQTIGNTTITEDELKKKYDYIIKNAILKADPTLEVLRADEELNPGSISNDIFTKLMHSKYVIADITYPNPNVFYELGIRHAIKPRTILIRENVNFDVPFDISHLRYIEYSHELDGMEKLAINLRRRFEFYEKNPDKPDNQFLELCSFTNYLPTTYAQPVVDKSEIIIKLLSMIFTNPNITAAFTNSSLSEEEQQQILFKEFAQNPNTANDFLNALVKSGFIDF